MKKLFALLLVLMAGKSYAANTVNAAFANDQDVRFNHVAYGNTKNTSLSTSVFVDMQPNGTTPMYKGSLDGTVVGTMVGEIDQRSTGGGTFFTGSLATPATTGTVVIDTSVPAQEIDVWCVACSGTESLGAVLSTDGGTVSSVTTGFYFPIYQTLPFKRDKIALYQTPGNSVSLFIQPAFAGSSEKYVVWVRRP